MKRIVLLLGLLIFAGWGAISFLDYARSTAQEMGMSGTVRAVAAAINAELQSKSSLSRSYCDSFSTGRHVLTPTQYVKLTNDLKTRHNLDTSDDWGRDNVLRDFWGQPLRIIFDKRRDGVCLVEVVCAGRDKVFGGHDVSSLK